MSDRGESSTGYLHADYAAALAEFGAPLHLDDCDGWVLTRPIGETGLYDARGCYPVFGCGNWPSLGDDLEALGNRLVSLVIVTDPFGEYQPEDLRRWFPDLCRPYKAHFVVDLAEPLERTMSRSHVRYARKASELVNVERCPDPAAHLREWTELYAELIARHDIKGISAFSKDSFCKQMQVPGQVAFRAIHEGVTVGMVLYYMHSGVAYYHLGAYNETGYRLRASYAIFAHSLALLSDHVRWVSLGAGAGVHGDSDDGLSRFKRGWATGTRDAFICGRVFDRQRYQELVSARNIEPGDFFPLYRKGEE